MSSARERLAQQRVFKIHEKQEFYRNLAIKIRALYTKVLRNGIWRECSGQSYSRMPSRLSLAMNAAWLIVPLDELQAEHSNWRLSR